MHATAFATRFHALDAFLTEYQHLWRPRPFVALQLPWEADHPVLAAWLRARSLAAAEAVHNAPHTLAGPEPFATLARVWGALWTASASARLRARSQAASAG